MHKALALTFLCQLIAISATAQIQLNIQITAIKNNTGHIYLSLRDSSNTEIRAIHAPIEDQQCSITINHLKPGSYSFKYFHDKNDNKKIDTNFMGIPKEGYGFSNNAKGRFGPPDFEDTLFELSKSTQVICKIYYITL